MIIAWDTETALIRPAQTAPPLTCLTWQEDEASPRISSNLASIETRFRGWLRYADAVLVGQNVAFDMGVMAEEYPSLLPDIFRAYDEDRVTDTMLRGKLLDIAAGWYRGRPEEVQADGTTVWRFQARRYSLEDLAYRDAGMRLKKDGFRLFYAFFRGLPLEQWPERAREIQARAAAILKGTHDPEFAYHAQGVTEKDLLGLVAADPEECTRYPLEDATATYAVWRAQEKHAEEYLKDQYRQARAAFWLHLTSAWGLRTNPLGVAKLQRATEDAYREVELALIAAGLVRENGSRDTTKAKERMVAVCHEKGLPVRVTPADEVALDADACKATDDDLLKKYAALTGLKAVLSKDIPALARASVYPIHTRFDLAETGRGTSSSPNVQNWRRLPGVRECFAPRPGCVYAQADYSGLELATLAQVCLDLFGESELAKVINAGIDPHMALAAEILGISYEEAKGRGKGDKDVDAARQTAKVANFGFPGGLGIEKLILFARKTYGVELTQASAKALKNAWLARWPEMRLYFAHVNSLVQGDRGATFAHVRSGRVRGGASYTAACNSYFQGLGSDATKGAGWLVAKACYVDTASTLYGSRIVNYVHDELIVETSEAGAPEAAEELSRLMVLGASEWIPDVKLQAEPCLMRVWSKDAKTLRDASGRLTPWSPPVAA